jgi:hypothetical protein
MSFQNMLIIFCIRVFMHTDERGSGSDRDLGQNVRMERDWEENAAVAMKREMRWIEMNTRHHTLIRSGSLPCSLIPVQRRMSAIRRPFLA